MTLPAFEAPISAPVAAPPAEANPFMPRDNPFVPPAHATPIAPPVHANPVVVPSIHASSVEAPAHVDPIVPSVQASPVEAPAHVSPLAPRVHANPVVRPAFVSPIVQPEDVNPVVRPVIEERLRVTPAAPPVREAPVQASPAAQPIAAPEVVSTLEAANFEPAIQVEAPKAVEPPFAEPAIDARLHESALTAPVVEAPAVEAPVVEAPVVEAPVVEARAQANAFETAPTEFAGSETPIATADTEAAFVAPLSGEAESSDETGVETSAPSSPDSEVAEAEIQSAPQTFPAPRPFTSSGSEMPVVITTPAPRMRDTAGAGSNLFGLGRELLPRAHAWSRKTLRAAPRALVITAPLIALFGIWAVRSLVSHSKHAPVAEANTDVVAQVAAATPAPPVTAADSAATPASPILASTGAAPAAPPPGADPAELASAVTHGLPALEALAQRFPNDPQVGIALAGQQAQAQRFEAAVESVEHVISVDVKSAQSGKVMGILWRAAQSSATEPSFSALRKLGGRGSDIAFDLATTAGVRDSVRDRAKTELTKSLSSEASEDTRVATALLLASDCDARKALLDRAEHDGGKRTQRILDGFSRGSVCTSKTDKACNACLTGSPALKSALAQVSARGGK